MALSENEVVVQQACKTLGMRLRIPLAGPFTPLPRPPAWLCALPVFLKTP
jgi:hypothetical protein